MSKYEAAIRLLGASNYWQANTMSDLLGVPARMLMNLESHEQLLFIEGKAQRCQRLNYLEDREFAGRYEANPRYTNNAERKFGRHDTSVQFL